MDVSAIDKLARQIDPTAWDIYDDPKWANLPERVRQGLVRESRWQAARNLVRGEIEAAMDSLVLGEPGEGPRGLAATLSVLDEMVAPENPDRVNRILLTKPGVH